MQTRPIRTVTGGAQGVGEDSVHLPGALEESWVGAAAMTRLLRGGPLGAAVAPDVTDLADRVLGQAPLPRVNIEVDDSAHTVSLCRYRYCLKNASILERVVVRYSGRS